MLENDIYKLASISLLIFVECWAWHLGAASACHIVVWFPDPSSPFKKKNAKKLGGRVWANGLLLGVARAGMQPWASVDEGKTLTTRGVHRTLTPRSQTLFHRLGTIPVEWEWLALINWTRILAPFILGHDSLVPRLICVSCAVWERDYGHK